MAALSQCHMLSCLHLAASAGIVVTAYADTPSGTMIENNDGSGEFTEVVLRPVVTVADASMRAGRRLARRRREAVLHSPFGQLSGPSSTGRGLGFPHAARIQLKRRPVLSCGPDSERYPSGEKKAFSGPGQHTAKLQTREIRAAVTATSVPSSSRHSASRVRSAKAGSTSDRVWKTGSSSCKGHSTARREVPPFVPEETTKP